MNMDYKNKGAILGMESVGAVYVGQDGDTIYFEIPKSSPLYYDEVMRDRAAQGCHHLTGKSIGINFIPPKFPDERR